MFVPGCVGNLMLGSPGAITSAGRVREPRLPSVGRAEPLTTPSWGKRNQERAGGQQNNHIYLSTGYNVGMHRTAGGGAQQGHESLGKGGMRDVEWGRVRITEAAGWGQEGSAAGHSAGGGGKYM